MAEAGAQAAEFRFGDFPNADEWADERWAENPWQATADMMQAQQVVRFTTQGPTEEAPASVACSAWPPEAVYTVPAAPVGMFGQGHSFMLVAGMNYMLPGISLPMGSYGAGGGTTVSSQDNLNGDDVAQTYGARIGIQSGGFVNRSFLHPSTFTSPDTAHGQAQMGTGASSEVVDPTPGVQLSTGNAISYGAGGGTTVSSQDNLNEDDVAQTYGARIGIPSGGFVNRSFLRPSTFTSPDSARGQAHMDIGASSQVVDTPKTNGKRRGKGKQVNRTSPDLTVPILESEVTGANEGTSATVWQNRNRRRPHPSASRSHDDTTNTTVMLRNMSGNYNQNLLQNLVDRMGFHRRYNALYSPFNFSDNSHAGFAFFNLLTHQDACEFMDVFEGFKDWGQSEAGLPFGRGKVATTAWANQQGQESFIRRYRNSDVMHPDNPDDIKPRLYKDGVRIGFPPPERKLRPPDRNGRKYGQPQAANDSDTAGT